MAGDAAEVNATAAAAAAAANAVKRRTKGKKLREKKSLAIVLTSNGKANTDTVPSLVRCS